MINTICLAHGLNRVAEEIRIQFPSVISTSESPIL